MPPKEVLEFAKKNKVEIVDFKLVDVPGSLEQALDALEKDHDFLLKGDVFTKDVIETWLEYKRKKEVDAMRMRPHPYEFAPSFDI